MGQGTSSNGVLQLFGLSDTSKVIVHIILEEDKYNINFYSSIYLLTCAIIIIIIIIFLFGIYI